MTPTRLIFELDFVNHGPWFAASNPCEVLLAAMDWMDAKRGDQDEWLWPNVMLDLRWIGWINRRGEASLAKSSVDLVYTWHDFTEASSERIEQRIAAGLEKAAREAWWRMEVELAHEAQDGPAFSSDVIPW